MSEFLFTSESVSEGHPDKVADQISDAVLDAILRQDTKARVAAETLVKDNLVVLAGEITTSARVRYDEVARATIRRIGYNDPALGFDASTCTVLIVYGQQSPNIAQGVDEGRGLDQSAQLARRRDPAEEDAVDRRRHRRRALVEGVQAEDPGPSARPGIRVLEWALLEDRSLLEKLNALIAAYDESALRKEKEEFESSDPLFRELSRADHVLTDAQLHELAAAVQADSAEIEAEFQTRNPLLHQDLPVSKDPALPAGPEVVAEEEPKVPLGQDLAHEVALRPRDQFLSFYKWKHAAEAPAVVLEAFDEVHRAVEGAA